MHGIWHVCFWLVWVPQGATQPGKVVLLVGVMTQVMPGAMTGPARPRRHQRLQRLYPPAGSDPLHGARDGHHGVSRHDPAAHPGVLP